MAAALDTTMDRLPRLAVGLGELSEMLGVDQKTLRRWAREHSMPTYRVGGRVLVLVADFEAWLRRHRDRPEVDVDAVVDAAVRATMGRLRGDAV